tara:strand:+ start:203 stop:562 length:360 start_codon:yes stop_codon:yes gene_type:complete
MKDRKLEDYQIILTIRVLDGSEDHVLPSIQDGMEFDEETGEGILHYAVQRVASDQTTGKVRVAQNRDAFDLRCAPDLWAYAQYVGDNLERIERGGWTPLCFEEFQGSEERETYQQGGNQ